MENVALVPCIGTCNEMFRGEGKTPRLALDHEPTENSFRGKLSGAADNITLRAEPREAPLPPSSSESLRGLDRGSVRYASEVFDRNNRKLAIVVLAKALNRLPSQVLSPLPLPGSVIVAIPFEAQETKPLLASLADRYDLHGHAVYLEHGDVVARYVRSPTLETLKSGFRDLANNQQIETQRLRGQEREMSTISAENARMITAQNTQIQEATDSTVELKQLVSNLTNVHQKMAGQLRARWDGRPNKPSDEVLWPKLKLDAPESSTHSENGSE